MGKGSVVFWGEAGEGCTSFEEASMTPSDLPQVGKDRFAFQVEESLTPSPCGQG